MNNFQKNLINLSNANIIKYTINIQNLNYNNYNKIMKKL